MRPSVRPGPSLWAAGPLLAALVGMAALADPPPRALIATAIHREGPPLAHTGGFGEPTCQACHSEFEVNPSAGALGIDGFPLTYVPGQRYGISISVLGGDMQYAGFQAAIRFAAGPTRGSSAGRFELLDGYVTVHRAPESGVEYLQHSIEGSQVVANGVATWTVAWVAPRDSVDVVLHVAANDANGDNSPLGDFVYASQVVSSATKHNIPPFDNR